MMIIMRRQAVRVRRVYVGLENVGALLGLLLAILRFRIPVRWVFFGLVVRYRS